MLSVCVCVCLSAYRQLERRASGVLPPGLGPDQSRVCQFAGTQTASLYTQHRTERERAGERDTNTDREREVWAEQQRSESIILS